MTVPRLSSETLHATSVARDGRAILIVGPSGAGKSDLALRLLDRGFTLVSDDQTIVRRDGDRLLATAPPSIAGKMEVRGIGIVDMAFEDNVALALFVELIGDVQRMPDEGRERQILGLSLPAVTLDAREASAPAKVDLALAQMGRDR